MPRSVARRILGFAQDTYRYAAFRPSSFRGVYGSFGEALSRVPQGTAVGYDHAELAREYACEPDLRLTPPGYAVLFHLSRVANGADSTVVLDFGGNVGIHYLRYKNFLPPGRIRWLVCDVPAIASAGRDLCAGLPEIGFVNDIAELREAKLDLLLASDSIQYVESLAEPASLIDRLNDQSLRPRHILIDWLPSHDGGRFVTLQNGGRACYPFYVFDRGRAIRDFAAAGYELVAHWDDHPGPFTIPFHRDRRFLCQGYYFRQKP
jgi:putative methyltransferase (TIGR04325 family)